MFFMVRASLFKKILFFQRKEIVIKQENYSFQVIQTVKSALIDFSLHRLPGNQIGNGDEISEFA